jgi:hypothetical protein
VFNTANDREPLLLSQVLREEYERLHGPIPSPSRQQVSEETRLAETYALIHKLARKRTALCLSGGGIRSATFGLGVLQGLARANLLERFDYLSTVSGGGHWELAFGMDQVAPTRDRGCSGRTSTAATGAIGHGAPAGHMAPQIQQFSQPTFGAALCRLLDADWNLPA